MQGFFYGAIAQGIIRLFSEVTLFKYNATILSQIVWISKVAVRPLES